MMNTLCQKEDPYSFSHWSDILHYKKRKKENSRSRSMFEIDNNPYTDENCCCCIDIMEQGSNHSTISQATISSDTTANVSIGSSSSSTYNPHHYNNNHHHRPYNHPGLLYSLLTSSTPVSFNQAGVSRDIYDPHLFLIRFSKVLVSCGAPSHRLDHCVQLIMQKFNLTVQFGYFPGFLVVSIGDSGILKSIFILTRKLLLLLLCFYLIVFIYLFIYYYNFIIILLLLLFSSL
jgi:hypothetical protein